LLTTGLDRSAKLFEVGTQSGSQKHINTVLLPDLPIFSGKFINQGKQALLTGNRKHYYLYDLSANKVDKLSGIMGHNDEKNLSKLFVGSNNYYGFSCNQSGHALIMS